MFQLYLIEQSITVICFFQTDCIQSILQKKKKKKNRERLEQNIFIDIRRHSFTLSFSVSFRLFLLSVSLFYLSASLSFLHTLSFFFYFFFSIYISFFSSKITLLPSLSTLLIVLFFLFFLCKILFYSFANQVLRIVFGREKRFCSDDFSLIREKIFLPIQIAIL